jgi:hypothetical protein
VLGELGEGDVAVVGAVEERADRRGLEEDVGLAFGVQLIRAEGPNVQGLDQAFVEHRRKSRSGVDPAVRGQREPPALAL